MSEHLNEKETPWTPKIFRDKRKLKVCPKIRRYYRYMVSTYLALNRVHGAFLTKLDHPKSREFLHRVLISVTGHGPMKFSVDCYFP